MPAGRHVLIGLVPGGARLKGKPKKRQGMCWKDHVSPAIGEEDVITADTTSPQPTPEPSCTAALVRWGREWVCGTAGQENGQKSYTKTVGSYVVTGRENSGPGVPQRVRDLC